jgi:hypothetical protein
VQTLVNEARTFAAGVSTTYGTGADTARGEAFVPLAGSTLQTAIATRLTMLRPQIDLTQYFAGPKIRLAFVPLPLIGAAIVIYTLMTGHKL